MTDTVSESDSKTAVDDKKKPEVTIHSPIFGPLPLDEFSQKYRSIWDQVADKKYMLRGYLTHEADVAGQAFTLRTLRRGEEAALALWAPSLSVEEDPRMSDARRHEAHGEAYARQYAASIRRLAVHLDGGVFLSSRVELPKLTVETAKSWLLEASVLQLLAALENFDAGVVSVLLDIVYDMETARALALRENLRNPTKVPTPTTARRQ